MKFLPVLPLALAALFALPQANAADIKQNNINTCVNGAVKYKVADKNTATKLCKCTIGVRSNMTIGQMWEIESYAHQAREELRGKVGALAIAGAQKILGREIDANAHKALIDQLVTEI